MEDKFKKQVNLTNTEKNILESLRFQDEDLSQKLGSTLSFSGLMIAASIVMLSTSNDAILHINKNNVFLLILNSLGLLLLYFSGIKAILTLISTTDYPNDPQIALIEYDKYLKAKKDSLILSSRLLLLGTSFIILSLIIIFIINIFC